MFIAFRVRLLLTTFQIIRRGLQGGRNDLINNVGAPKFINRRSNPVHFPGMQGYSISLSNRSNLNWLERRNSFSLWTGSVFFRPHPNLNFAKFVNFCIKHLSNYQFSLFDVLEFPIFLLIIYLLIDDSYIYN